MKIVWEVLLYPLDNWVECATGLLLETSQTKALFQKFSVISLKELTLFLCLFRIRSYSQCASSWSSENWNNTKFQVTANVDFEASSLVCDVLLFQDTKRRCSDISVLCSCRGIEDCFWGVFQGLRIDWMQCFGSRWSFSYRALETKWRAYWNKQTLTQS